MSQKNQSRKNSRRAMWFLENHAERVRSKTTEGRAGISLDELQASYRGFTRAMQHRDAKRAGKASRASEKAN